MIDTGDLRRGIVLNMDGELVRVTEFQHMKQGRGSAFVRLSLKNLRTGSTTSQTFQAGTKFEAVRLERVRAQYLYAEDDLHHFMDIDTFEQMAMNTETLGESLNYTTPDMIIELLTHEGQPIDIELPTSVDLEVTETDPGHRGDTATGGSKPARLETGITVSVPLFVNQGEKVKVDTRTGEYMERVS